MMRKLIQCSLVTFGMTVLTALPASAHPLKNLHHGFLAAEAMTERAGASIVVGTETLKPCGNTGAYCGRFDRPLDPTGEVKGRINIFYQWYPHTDQTKPRNGVLVTVDGGPGYGSTGSASSFLALFDPLRATRDVLIVDNRGTGRSGALNCKPEQQSHAQRLKDVNLCAAQLARTGHLYGSRLAVEDMGSILSALHTGKVDMYGDSYGTFYEQVFASVYPNRLRSLILDSAYQARGGSAFYPEFHASLIRIFNQVCRASAPCASLGGTSLNRIETLLVKLRVAPFKGMASDSNGRIRTVEANAENVFYVMAYGSGGPTVVRELDAAARAYLDSGDSTPLLRLIAEATVLGDGTDISTAPSYYSKALFAAVSCSDYQQSYDLRSNFDLRKSQQAQAIAAQLKKTPALYAPFTIDEFRRSAYQEDSLDLCLQWRWPSALYTPGQSVLPNALLSSAPTLVLSSDLDMTTTNAEAKAVALQFPHATYLVVDNSFHVSALGDLDNCTSNIVNAFVTNLSAGDTRCTKTIPSVRTVPDFTTRAAMLDPVTALAGNEATAGERRIVAAVLATVGDTVMRYYTNYFGTVPGLRGGVTVFDYSQTNISGMTLKQVRWTDDVAVSGSAVWDQANRVVTANVTAVDELGRQANLHITWSTAVPHPQAQISGDISGHVVVAQAMAP